MGLGGVFMIHDIKVRDMGCQFGQGYHLARPMSVQAVHLLLQDLLEARAAAISVYAELDRPSVLH